MSHCQQLQAQTNSAPISPGSATRADDGLIKACAEAVEELKAARILIKAQDSELETSNRLIELQTKIESMQKNIYSLSDREKEELRKALAAKDRVIASLETANSELKKNKLTVWKVAKIVIVAGAAGLILGKTL